MADRLIQLQELSSRLRLDECYNLPLASKPNPARRMSMWTMEMIFIQDAKYGGVDTVDLRWSVGSEDNYLPSLDPARSYGLNQPLRWPPYSRHEEIST